MTEFELKFEIPAASLAQISAAMLEGKASRQRLQAFYFDTAEGTLARHGLVVRVRKEGRRWVQTAKGPTAGPLERLEHNASLARQSTGHTPEPDVSLHAATPVGKAIYKALQLKPGKPCPPLIQLYETDIQRMTRRVDVDGAVVELALDQGHILANGRSLAVCELEVELKTGQPGQAVELAREWCARHGLWLSSISKSMKGQRLQKGLPTGAVVTAMAPEFKRHAPTAEVVAAVWQSCLHQILPNASDIAAGSEDPGHVHQLRIGIRRLRTALRELRGLADGMDPSWEPALVQVFRELGRHRDQEHLVLDLQPQLEAAGGPRVKPGPSGTPLPERTAIVRSPAFQQALLGLVGFAHGTARELAEGEGEAGHRAGAKKLLRLRLQKLHARAIKDGRNFLSLDEAQQHSVRKRLKRLRYLTEFSAPLFPEHRVKAFVDALKPAQDALGLYNDELMALHAWQKLADADQKAWFGIGWLTARRLPNARHCLKTIKSLAKLRPFWD
ncbi:MAG: adenylate cyclase [Polaromonas sp.]|nr:adenylate cyclase [Polaromonas sp.]